MAQANPEGWGARADDLGDRLGRVGDRCRVARAVRQEHAVGLHRQHLGRLGARGYHRHPTPVPSQPAQDAALDTEVVGHHAMTRRGRRGGVARRPPEPLVPLVGLARGDLEDQIAALERRMPARLGHRRFRVTDRAGDEGALGAADADPTRHGPRVDAGDPGDAVSGHQGRQGPLGAPVRHARRKLAHDEPSAVGPRRLQVLGVRPDVSNLGGRHQDDLAPVGRIAEDFLVAGDGGVEHQLTRHVAGCAEATARPDAAVLEREQRRREIGGGLSRRSRGWCWRLSGGLRQRPSPPDARYVRPRWLTRLGREKHARQRGCSWIWSGKAKARSASRPRDRSR